MTTSMYDDDVWEDPYGDPDADREAWAQDWAELAGERAELPSLVVTDEPGHRFDLEAAQ